MDILTIILEQIGLFVIYIIVGVLLVKAKVFNATTGAHRTDARVQVCQKAAV